MIDLPQIGLYDANLRFGEPAEITRLAQEIEALGFALVWVPDLGGDIAGDLARVLSATSTLAVGTGILNLWMHEPDTIAAQWAALCGQYKDRLVFGLGVSHKPLVDALAPGRFGAPLSAVHSYLDALDYADPPLGSEERLLAAQRPKMLEIARDRCAGAFPYHMTPEHTRRARALLGPEKTLVVEQPVAFCTDHRAARELIDPHLGQYLPLPNYANAWRWLGFDDSDLQDGGSDHFVASIVAIGDEETIRARVQEHLDAGADHVCVQVLAADNEQRLEAWRVLASALL